MAAACSAEVSKSADARSEIELAFAAVILPSLAKAGRSVGIFSILALKGCSSLSTMTSTLRDVTETVTISSSKYPLYTAVC